MRPHPNFFIIGAPKSGTTAMAQYLSTHPSIFFSNPKELFYWNDDFPRLRDGHGIYNDEQYLSYFSAADVARHRAIGEGSTTYLQSRSAVSKILEFNPQAKLIAMLRHPVETVQAMHGELYLKSMETEPDFEKAWELQAERAAGKSLPDSFTINQLQYRDVAAFGQQLQRLFDVVPSGQRLVLLYDDFKTNPAQAYAQILQFLGLEHDGRTEFPKTNVSREYRMRWLGRLYHTPPRVLSRPMRVIQRMYAATSHEFKDRVRTMVTRKKSRPALRPEFKHHLCEVFRDEVAMTSQLLGRDLTHWTQV